MRAQVAYAPDVPRFQVIHVWHAVARRHGATAVREYGRGAGQEGSGLQGDQSRAVGYTASRAAGRVSNLKRNFRV